MGDRVLFQVYKKANGKAEEISPVIYGHWAGSDAPAIVEALQKRMKGREGDVSYTAARLLQELIGDDDGHLSFGLWNSPKLMKESHGDAGIVRIECTPEGLRFDCLDGYLEASADRTSIKIA